ncbi:hypothetical protein DBR47_04535 [Paucibacter sp. KBW04]|uniref:hypothetical protein n=1 Tax=Paucibacter sp. KBW04 TaxID=2153361 RepID=UPI000F57E2AA|nr:hypothetical protein [Paucibacter sp. KBW04]RQO62498.1 hypothetical protein DBR47_04535 [Paucibacter sp. KBW04]
MPKSLLWIGALLLAPVIYNLDAIAGQWKFNKMCREEGGPRFYAPLEKDVGWEVEGHDPEDMAQPFRFERVAFVRFQDKENQWHDVRVDGWLGPYRRKFIFSPVAPDHPVRYRYRDFRERMTDERFGKSHRQVIDLSNGQIVASYTQISYEWTKPERMLLAAPTATGCWNQQGDFDQFFKHIFDLGSK